MIKRHHNDVVFEVRVHPRLLWRVAAIGLLLALTGLGGRITPARASMQAVMDPGAFASLLPLVEPPGSPLPNVLGTVRIGVSLTGDFNEDGHLDFVATADNVLQTYIGDGKGNFSLGPSSLFEPVQPDKNGITVITFNGQKFLTSLSGQAVDLDRDGHLDIVIVSEFQDLSSLTVARRLYTFLGNGAGLFESPQPPQLLETFALDSPRFGTPVTLVTTDINQDSLLDVVLVDIIPKKTDFRLLKGNSDGTFAAAEPLSVDLPDTVFSEAFSGDFNQDDFVDIALRSNQGVTLLQGNKTEGFIVQDALTLPKEQTLNSLTFADINGDGLTDFVAVIDQRTLSIFLQQDKNYSLLSSTTINVPVSRVIVGDFNADQRPDLALFVKSQQTVKEIFNIGQNKFSFSEPINYHITLPFEKVLVRDVNEDQRDDFIITDGSRPQVLAHQSEPQGMERVSIGGNALLGAGDFDGDGDPDLVVGGQRLDVLWNNGNGVFLQQELAQFKGGRKFLRGASGDLNGDGKDEFIAMSLKSFRNTPGAPIDGFLDVVQANAVTSYPFTLEGINLGVGDLDGDGNLDVVTTGLANVTVWLGDGTGALKPQTFPVDGPLSLAEVGDFDGDGRAEIMAVVTPDLAEVVALQLENGQITASEPLVSLDSAPLSLARADLNADDIPDVAVMSAFIHVRTQKVVGTEITFIRQQGQSGFQVTQYSVPGWDSNAAPFPFTGISAGDFDGDGLAEVGFSAIRQGAAVRVLKGTKQADVFKAELDFPCPGGPLLARDVNQKAPVELIAATVALNPYVCVAWRGGEGQ